MFHFRLVLDNVRGRDEGSYKCRVDFRQAPTRISNIDLHVIGKKLIMHDNKAIRNKMKIWYDDIFHNECPLYLL